MPCPPAELTCGHDFYMPCDPPKLTPETDVGVSNSNGAERHTTFCEQWQDHESTTAFEESLSAELAKLRLSILKTYRASLGHSHTNPNAANEVQPNGHKNSDRASSVWTFGTAANNKTDALKRRSTKKSTRSERDSSDLVKRLPSEELGEPMMSTNFSELNGWNQKTPRAARAASIIFGRFNKSTNAQGIPIHEDKWTYEQIAESPEFDSAVACVVFINCFFMCGEAQMDGVEVGNELFGYSDIHFSDTWKVAFVIVEYIFLSAYFLEMAFKLTALRLKYFKSAWNILDGLTVIVAIICIVLSVGIEVDPTLLRLARLAKLLRITHILRSVKFFDSFIVLINSLKASVLALFWSLFFIVVMISSSAFILNEVLLAYLRNEGLKSGDEQNELEVFLYFGTFTRAVVTMFEMTLGNWGPPTWLLINSVNEFWGGFMIFYKVTAGFAMLNVINAVFLRLTMKEADALDTHAIEQAKKEAAKYQEKVEKLFEVMDTSGDGRLSREEFELICQSNSLKAWMRLMNVSTHDFDSLWAAIDDGDGFIDKQEFLEGFCKLNGYASAIDANCIKAMIRELGFASGYQISTGTSPMREKTVASLVSNA